MTYYDFVASTAAQLLAAHYPEYVAAELIAVGNPDVAEAVDDRLNNIINDAIALADKLCERGLLAPIS